MSPEQTRLVALLMAGVFSAATIAITSPSEKTRFDQQALGPATVDAAELFTIKIGGVETYVHTSTVNTALAAVQEARNRVTSHRVLWLGNSQLHGINQYRNYDRTAPQILHTQLAEKHIEAISFSLPNANLQELYVLFTFARTRCQLNTIVLALCFDDLREDGLRAGYGNLLDPPTREALSSTAIGKKLLDTAKYGGDKQENNVSKHTTQQIVEEKLDHLLDVYFPLWAKRAEARGRIFLELYRLRNRLFQITPQTKRSLIKGPLERNLAAFDAITAAAKDANIDLIVYIAPIRQDLESPYVADEYTSVKELVEEKADQAKATFLNLESLVPPQQWGEKDSISSAGERDVDFMHFKATGHRLLADEIARVLLQTIPSRTK